MSCLEQISHMIAHMVAALISKRRFEYAIWHCLEFLSYDCNIGMADNDNSFPSNMRGADILLSKKFITNEMRRFKVIFCCLFKVLASAGHGRPKRRANIGRFSKVTSEGSSSTSSSEALLLKLFCSAALLLELLCVEVCVELGLLLGLLLCVEQSLVLTLELMFRNLRPSSEEVFGCESSRSSSVC